MNAVNNETDDSLKQWSHKNFSNRKWIQQIRKWPTKNRKDLIKDCNTINVIGKVTTKQCSKNHVVLCLLRYFYFGTFLVTAPIYFQLVYRSPLCPHCVWKIHRLGMTQSIWNFWSVGWFVGTSCQSIGNSKTRRTQQLTIIYWNVLL